MTDPVQRVNDLRAKVMAGEELTLEEAKEAVQLLRADRESRQTPTEKALKSLPTDLKDLF